MTNTRIVIENFAGQIPRRSRHLIPSNFATKAYDVKLKSGEIRGIHRLKKLHTFADPDTVKAYRLQDDDAADGFSWLGLTSREIDVFRGPLLNDKFDRYYMFGDGPPKYSTLARIKADDPWYLLGVPSPTNALALTPPSGGSDPSATRSYVYTFVSSFGEESAPSLPTTDTGKSGGTWLVSDMEVAVPDMDQRDITHKRIYRTVTGYSTSTFFLVVELNLGVTSYNDDFSDNEVSRNSLLESTNWSTPPPDITGAVIMPNGFFLAWDGRNIHFSETYRPHAWPAGYDLATEYDVIGAGVFGQSVGIVTAGTPYIATGAAPAGTTLTKVATSEPGLGKHSIVSMAYGVVYASQNGLAMLNSSGISIPTLNLVTKTEWTTHYNPTALYAAQYETQYLGFYAHDRGIVIDPQDASDSFTEVTKFSDVDFAQTDVHSGEAYLMIRGEAFLWDAVDRARAGYQWRSKVFEVDKPCNFGAAKLNLTTTTEAMETLLPIIEAYEAYNTDRMAAAPLDTIGSMVLGGTEVVPLAQPHDLIDQARQPLGGSPLYPVPVNLAPTDLAVRFNVYADGTLVFSEMATNGQVIRLPSGFKAREWAFEVIGFTPVHSIKIAETAKGLADV